MHGFRLRKNKIVSNEERKEMSSSGSVLEGKIDINSNGDGTFSIRVALTGQSDQQTN